MGTRGMLQTRRTLRCAASVMSDPTQRKNFHEQYGGEYYTADPDRIFSDPSVDIVSIATSHSSHADLGGCCPLMPESISIWRSRWQ